MDIIDGREVPPKVVSGQETIFGTHRGSIDVEAGGHLRLDGTLQGSLDVASGAAAEIYGSHQGTLNVSRAAHVQVHGRQQGSVNVEAGGLVEVARTGRLQGSLNVNGRLVNGGMRGGSVTGNGQIEDVAGSTVVQPERQPDGTLIYRWPS